MSYSLRTRQGLLVAVGIAYVFVLAWFNRQPIPTATLVHETDSSLRLRETGAGRLGSGNRDMYWLEPARYLDDRDGQAQSVVDIDAGLLHIRLHTEYRTARPHEPLGGLLKVYRKRLRFATHAAREDAWELLFAERLPGLVRRAHLDRTRLRNDDGSYAPRNLAVLYYMPHNETAAYRVRTYELESLQRSAGFERAVQLAGAQWWERARDVGAAEAALHAQHIADTLQLCPDDSQDVADSVYAGRGFSRCVGPSGLALRTVDFPLPGALEVLEFSLRGRTLLYSRLNDVVRFRMLELAAAANGTLLGAGAGAVQTQGPDVTELLRDIGAQSFLAQLASTRPGGGVDVFQAHGSTASDTFYFSFSLLQNTTLARRWIHEDVKRYRLPVHQQFSGLSRDELRLVNDAPLVDQAGLASVFYFKATDIIVAVDTQWFRDHGSADVAQLQRVRESRPPYISTLNSPVAVNMTLDDSGALLALSTVDDELFVFARARASATRRILDYRRYFADASLRAWTATERVSSVDALDEGDSDAFNWKLVLTWQPPTQMPAVPWDDGFISPENPFPATQRLVARALPQPTTACLRFLRFEPAQFAAGAAAAATAGDTAVVRVAALSVAGRLRMWELDSHQQDPHVLWPFIAEHWGLLFILGAVVACCVYNERRWA
ncbi:hypothetical protein IWW55_003615 [Coemansia sp. RSA 2706]|nr:hypothetical protein LPJ63_002391 [Coemansia sp. RSA 2711]KAJ2302029.1 hypothetical protein IWW55_003615 [Coemansia sp. RSA 2706]KAJ2306596.1 hypothetical protein IWW54_004687 [Coemansia sp. RSA 2705]KAJ2313946.1 hypothetical protein IWW52_004419 [Coemansia sp. RSA 2704]KAJ2324555.1 hypothetical protein IWW51_003219 [Coemansia sp. RSA 2702]KAJ2724469.1 hypothetical protein H4R23_004258 [Coemansia sp. Cherry 401B]